MTAPLPQRLLERASHEARRRGHREAQLEHLALAILELPALTRELTRRGVSTALFGDEIDAALLAYEAVRVTATAPGPLRLALHFTRS